MTEMKQGSKLRGGNGCINGDTDLCTCGDTDLCTCFYKCNKCGDAVKPSKYGSYSIDHLEKTRGSMQQKSW